MAKRFTDTGKWKRPWFRALGLHAKILWTYLLDECDHSGIFIADFDLISFQVGFKVDAEKMKTWLGDKLVRLDNDKFFIPSFLDFQYGAADTKFRAKQSAIEKLAAYGLIDSEGKFKDLTNSYLTLTEELPNSIGIGIGKGKSNLKGGVGETVENVSQLDLDGVYRSYPLKKVRPVECGLPPPRLTTVPTWTS